ncbi:hypothetical protein ABZ172_20250 [Streptomyces sp. NPDC006296]|uniref:hypothetical protein n=1 Tax=Streptomyces sp. NPDC006296 TaxID=3156746 RepID=UPI00339F522D
MQSLKLTRRTEPQPDTDAVTTAFTAPDEDTVLDAYDTVGMYRVICPDCSRAIALLEDEDVLPQHALCATPWNPFVLTVCPGTNSDASRARPADEAPGVQEQEAALLLTLPQGLDWRMQPFSHAGGPGSRPLRYLPQAQRQAA